MTGDYPYKLDFPYKSCNCSLPYHLCCGANAMWIPPRWTLPFVFSDSKTTVAVSASPKRRRYRRVK